MEFDGETLLIGREISDLDRKVFSFVDLFEESGIDYVLVSGYVSILAGRSRGTEDVDIIIEELDREEIDNFVRSVSERGYWLLNVSKENIFSMLADGLAVRFAEQDEVIPNFEVRFAKDEIEKEALKNRIKAKIRSKNIYISPLELQISYKLFMGSDKDFEDALHLYEIFKENLDREKLEKYSKKLDVRGELDELRKT